MSEIQYMEKPEWVDWSKIQSCMHVSHQTNKKIGFEMVNSNISTQKLQDELKNGRCFVALDDSNVVGVACLKLMKNKRKWWTRKLVSYHCFDAILPEYRGTDVYLGLKKIRDNYDKACGVRIIQFHTAEGNKTVLKINEKMGCKRVQFAPTGHGATYYSVTMVKWIDGCPYPNWFVSFMYNLSKIISKTFFTPGYKFRFWFH